MRFRLLFFLTLSMWLFALISAVNALAPDIFSFQGRLTDAGGNPLTGTYSIQFAIYSAPSGGSALWTETHPSVVVSNGLFTVGLGAFDPSVWTAVQGIPRYLGVKVGADPEMTPRTQLMAAPYAQRVASIDSAFGGYIIGGINGVSLGSGSVNAPAGMVTSTVYASGNGQFATGNSAAAVYGSASSPSVNSIALFGRANGPTLNLGVYGYSNDASSMPAANSAGVYGRSVSTVGGTVWAGLFDGWVQVNGNFYATAKSFRIDDPEKPAERTLTHACVESDEYKNVYDGTVLLDATGGATVTLPEWFDNLNGDYRYQLTAIGAPGPNLFISQELTNNQFAIAGGSAGMKVSWQVTGVRKDAYALAHPVQVIQEKPLALRGRYLNPKEHGMPEELSAFQDVRNAAEVHAETMRTQQTQVTDPKKLGGKTPTSGD